MSTPKMPELSMYKYSGGGSLWIGSTLILYLFANYATNFRLMYYNPIGLLIMLGYIAFMVYILRRKSINPWPAIKKLGWVLLFFIIIGSYYQTKIRSGELVIQPGFVYSEVVLIACGTIGTYLGLILLLIYLFRKKIDPLLSQPKTTDASDIRAKRGVKSLMLTY